MEAGRALPSALEGQSSIVFLILFKCSCTSCQYANDIQQRFSSETEATLCHGIPALEELYSEWEFRSKQSKYANMAPALQAGMAKIDEYYNKTATSHAYSFAMGMS